MALAILPYSVSKPRALFSRARIAPSPAKLRMPTKASGRPSLQWFTVNQFFNLPGKSRISATSKSDAPDVASAANVLNCVQFSLNNYFLRVYFKVSMGSESFTTGAKLARGWMGFLQCSPELDSESQGPGSFMHYNGGAARPTQEERSEFPTRDIFIRGSQIDERQLGWSRFIATQRLSYSTPDISLSATQAARDKSLHA